MPEESPPSPTLDSLAAEITKLSGMLTDYMRTNGVPAPSFEVNSPEGYGDLPPDVFRARQLLLDALMDMWFLTWGPSGGVFAFAHTVCCDCFVCASFLSLGIAFARVVKSTSCGEMKKARRYDAIVCL